MKRGGTRARAHAHARDIKIKMAKSTVLTKFNTAVNEAVKDGRLDRRKHGALIEAARKMAATMDREGWPIIDGKFDNVTPSTFQKYCEALHLTPSSTASEDIDNAIKLVGNSKWKKAAGND